MIKKTDERLSLELQELSVKLGQFAEYLKNKEYEPAREFYYGLVTYFSGIEENFKIKGDNFEYAFIEYFVAIIHLKISFYAEAIYSKDLLGLTKDDVIVARTSFSEFVINAIEYLSHVPASVKAYADKKYYNNVFEHSKFSFYYNKHIAAINGLWVKDIDSYINGDIGAEFETLAIAVGSFYNQPPNRVLSTMSIDLITTAAKLPDSNVPYIAADGSLVCPVYVKGKAWYVDGDISSLGISYDKSREPRTTGLQYTKLFDGRPIITYLMGMLPNNPAYPDYNVNIEIKNLSKIIEFTIFYDSFVSGLKFNDINNESLSCGRSSDRYTYSTNIAPFSVYAIFVPPDISCYEASSGHQMGGIAIQAKYDNTIAKKYVESIQAIQ
ncbi:hypothetical protein [Symbiopectobacterium purcellii]|uniref:hypothetical protein n=1 Tax=Symbiopectobacterium purcellii TaxID=2871826 RepID=UPI003F82DA5B